MNHTALLYVAHQPLNEAMRCADLRPAYKWFIEFRKVSFQTTSVIDAAYFERMISESKAALGANGFWIPAIRYMDNLFVDPEVKILSDGTREIFVT